MPFKDSDYVAHRFVDIVQEEEGKGKICWFKRTDLYKDSITECLLCREAEEEMYTKRYAILYTRYRDEYTHMLYARQYADDQLCS